MFSEFYEADETLRTMSRYIKFQYNYFNPVLLTYFYTNLTQKIIFIFFVMFALLMKYFLCEYE